MLRRPYYCKMPLVFERKIRQKRPSHTCQLALKLSQRTLLLMQHYKKERNVTFIILLIIHDTHITCRILKNKRLPISLLNSNLRVITGWVNWLVDSFVAWWIKLIIYCLRWRVISPVVLTSGCSSIFSSRPQRNGSEQLLLRRGLAAGCTRTLLCSGGSAGRLRRPDRGSANGMLFSQACSAHTVTISWKRKKWGPLIRTQRTEFTSQFILI